MRNSFKFRDTLSASSTSEILSCLLPNSQGLASPCMGILDVRVFTFGIIEESSILININALFRITNAIASSGFILDRPRGGQFYAKHKY